MAVITDETKRRITDYLGLALGLFISVQFSAACSEYEVRNGFSRLYYAFFHVALAFLLSRGDDVDLYRREHGRVHTAVDKRMGKYLGRFFRELYSARQQSDYEPAFLVTKYGGDLEKARADARNILDRASRNFYWIYNESRKVL